jgi:hypothetical protein
MGERADGCLVHNVYFTLNDNSAAAREQLIASMRKYLTDHPGVIFFATGTLTPDLSRPVNVQDWEVSAHVVFRTRADHDAYQIAPRHQQFIAENKANWKQVRVFDSDGCIPPAV